MTVYAVFKRGAYRHECAGIFSAKEAADRCAAACAAEDFDDWHSYEVFPFVVDQPTERLKPTSCYSPTLVEPLRASVFRKEK